MKNVLKKWTGLSLYVQIFIGLGLGIACGLIFGERMSVLSPVGDIFLRLMKMVIVPVVFFSLIGGVASLASAGKKSPVAALWYLEMLNGGIFPAHRGLFAISTVMTEAEIDKAIAVFAHSLDVIKPYMA